jgi:hypothetical protein
VSAEPDKGALLTPLAELLAYLGLVPVVLCPLAMAFLPEYWQRELAQRTAIAWGATMLAGLGAVHFGLALAGRMRFGPRQLAGAVIPAIGATGGVLLGGERGLALLVVLLGLFWHYERSIADGALPPDYLRLRRNLTLAGCSLLAITMILSDYVGLS